MTPLSVYIGYDEREDAAYEVCKNSLLRHSSVPLRIVKLHISILKKIGLYNRRYKIVNGQMIDEVDGRPFSTQFSFSRFLVPTLNLFQDWALFMDCDFLFTRDIAELLPLLDEKYAAMCVKHNYMPRETVKMDGQSQGVYLRKNWSSFTLWNCAHEANQFLNIRTVNVESGKWLHGFSWLNDDRIGALPKEWNHLVGVDEHPSNTPAALHYTLGTPVMHGYENCEYSDLWVGELSRVEANRETRLLLERNI